jgi:hypothetical protein
MLEVSGSASPDWLAGIEVGTAFIRWGGALKLNSRDANQAPKQKSRRLWKKRRRLAVASQRRGEHRLRHASNPVVDEGYLVTMNLFVDLRKVAN